MLDKPETELLIRPLKCPKCGVWHKTIVTPKQDKNLRRWFPTTYAVGFSVCYNCLMSNLERVK